MTVHVMAPPDPRELKDDEAICWQPQTDDHAVVFHPRSVRSEGGHWLCPDCGESSE